MGVKQVGRRWKLAGFLCIVGAALFLWPQAPPNNPRPTHLTAPVPNMTALQNFFQFPWGISRNEALTIAETQKLPPTPPGFLDYRGKDLLYNVSFAGCPAVLRCGFREQVNTPYSLFYRGTVTISGKNCPVEKLYSELHKQLSAEYGASPDVGYPPRRNTGATQPWASGSGSIWTVTTPAGQLFEIISELELTNPGLLRLSIHNISVERQFKNLVNPTPPGDPAQAESSLKGFLGISWGSAPDRFRREMAEQGFLFVQETSNSASRETHVQFAKGEYAGLPVKSIDGLFKHGAMYLVSVDITGGAGDSGGDVYEKAKRHLQEQYGTPLEQKNFRQDTVHVWLFPLAGFKPNRVMLHRYNAAVMIQFWNQALEDKLNNL